MLAVAAVTAATVAVYWNVLHGQFVFDDQLVVLRDARIRGSISSAWRLFLPWTAEATHRPLRTFSYVIDYNIGGLNPWIFHASNLVYHILAVWAVFALGSRLTGSRAAALTAAVIFALHPVQTDAVSYISGRRDVLCGLFFFVSVLAYVRYREGGGRSWLGVTFLCEVLALLAKEMAATLPAVFLLVDLWRSRKGTFVSQLSSAFRNYGRVYLTAIFLCGLCLFLYYGNTIASEALKTPWYGGSIGANIATTARIWVHYGQLLLYPAKLVADYQGGFPVSTSAMEREALLSLGAVAVFLLGGAYLFKRRFIAGFGLAWIALTLLPVSHLVPYHELLAEHYLYIPSFGFALVLGTLIQRFGASSKAAKILASGLAVALLVALGWRTLERNRDWENPIAFYTTLTRDNPKAVRGHLGLAVALLKAGLRQAAVRELHTALQLDSDDPRTILDLGIAVHQIGWRREAERLYKKALEKRPTYPQALNNLALLYLQEQRYDEAAPLLETAAAVTKENDATVLATYGLLHELQGRPEAALSYYRKALRLRPDRGLLKKKITALSNKLKSKPNGRPTGDGEASQATK